MSLDKNWILSERGLPRAADTWAEKIGTDLASSDGELKALTTSQLRRFFGNLKRLQAIGFTENKASQLLRLKPLLAYAVGRDKKGGRSSTKIGKFYHELSVAIDVVLDATENVVAGGPSQESRQQDKFEKVVIFTF